MGVFFRLQTKQAREMELNGWGKEEANINFIDIFLNIYNEIKSKG